MANVIFMRFGAQLLWYRQEGLLRASGIDLNRSTLMSWSNRIATQALLPLYELLMRELLQNSARLFMDETTIPMLVPGKGQTITSHLFALHRDDRSFGGNLPPIVVFIPSKTRAMYKIHHILSGSTAIVQTDAYAGYGQLGREGTVVEGIISPKCWAHTRRHFTDADLPPDGPSFITRVCGSGFHNLGFRFGQARRARSPQIAQALGALAVASGFRATNAA
jgi:transposase